MVHLPLSLGHREVEQMVGSHSVARGTRFEVHVLFLQRQRATGQRSKIQVHISTKLSCGHLLSTRTATTRAAIAAIATAVVSALNISNNMRQNTRPEPSVSV
jgi:hypothetical protein